MFPLGIDPFIVVPFEDLHNGPEGIFKHLVHRSCQLVQEVLVPLHGQQATSLADKIYDRIDTAVADAVAGMPSDSTHFNWNRGKFVHFINRKDKDGRNTLPYVMMRGLQAVTPCSPPHPYPFTQLVPYVQGDHLRDMMKFIPEVFAQDFVFMTGTLDIELTEAASFKWYWQDGRWKMSRSTTSRTLTAHEVGSLVVESLSCYLAWWDLYKKITVPERQLQELLLLQKEYTDAAQLVFGLQAPANHH